MPQIQYSEKYFDDTYEYRSVFLDLSFNSLSFLRVSERAKFHQIAYEEFLPGL